MKADGTYGRPNGVARVMRDRMTVAEAQSLPASISPEDAELVLGMSKGKICAMLRRGEIPGRKLGGCWRIPTEKLFRYMAGEDIA